MNNKLQLRMRVTRCIFPPQGTFASAVFLISLAAHSAEGDQRMQTVRDGAAPPRHLELRHLIEHDCGSCHGMTLAGGLGPALTASALRDKPIQYIEAMILRGRPGTAMPGWAGMLSESDVHWIAQQLKQGFDR